MSEGMIKKRLLKTRQLFSSLFSKSKTIDEDFLTELEDHLIIADMGIETTEEIMQQVRRSIKQDKINQVDKLIDAIRKQIEQALAENNTKLVADEKPHVIVLVGVNGVGKTTTAARLGNYFKQQGKAVMFAACDTYRAAAIEQLQDWAGKVGAPIVSQEHGADAPAVAHDAYHSAVAKNADVLIIDTAGRQHTHSSFMEQLGKLNRVLKKLNPQIPHETIIVIDAANGQNALSQVSHFNKIVALSGVIVTKLDGTAKGGIVIALKKEFNLPVYFIGVGEALNDLKVFDAHEYAQAVLPDIS